MKKQILTFMALALFTFTGTAFAANKMSSFKKDKEKMSQMYPVQEKKMFGNKYRQELMSQMFGIRQHVMQLLENFKKDNGNKPLTEIQKDQIYAMMLQMMPKTPEEKAKVKDVCILIHKMMQQMQKENNAGS